MAISQFEITNADTVLVAELAAECSIFGYRAIFAAVTDSFEKNNAKLFETLGAQLSRYGISLIVPISYAPFCENVAFCASTSISGGSLREYLDSLISNINGVPFYLEHPLTQIRFTMPSLTGDGMSITRSELSEILERQEVQAFYSPELFLNYCTYRQNGTPHFLLFDDTRTLQAKIELGQTLGVAGQFLLYRELGNFYPML